MSKPRVLDLYNDDGEHIGYFTKGVKDKEMAARLMREDAEREQRLSGDIGDMRFTYKPEDIIVEKIEDDRYYQCRHCERETVGDNTCFDCGNTIGTNGRTTFSFMVH